ncbi:AlpA family phage regulatory protein [Ascidiaceihabitans sp.]|nr:AlpA family phage regulatory protein [Ascidiaceihabitans sp.]
MEKDMPTLELMTIHEVVVASKISKPTIYRLMKSGSFPRPVKLSPNRVAWRKIEILAWLNACPISEGF